MSGNFIKALVFVSLASWGGVHAQQTARLLPAEQEKALNYGADRLGKRQDVAMKKFRENRFGLFIHWGLYAITAGEWNGKVYGGPSSFLQKTAGIKPAEWMTLMNKWNPADFDADEWVKLAKKMGVKYIKLVTKHHEGFCLWPSKYSDYTVAHTPVKRDIVGELAKACKKGGIDLHLYYSILDWSHPDYRYSLKTEDDREAFRRFLNFAENQIKELATRYPTVTDFWFDGTWDQSFKENGWWSAHIEKMLKEIIPGVTVNSRLRADDFGKRHFDSNGHLMGDYESWYERRLPDPVKDLRITRWDWEGYTTLPENQWGYYKDWSLSYVKTPYEVLQRIVHAVSMGGNMVVNFGPKADGSFRAEEKQMAEVLGGWMKKYGEAVYGCDYAGWEKKDWGYYTKKGDHVYMLVFNMPCSGKLNVKVPDGVKITKACVVNGKEVKAVEIARNEFNVDMPSERSGEPFVIKLDIKQKGNETDKYFDALI